MPNKWDDEPPTTPGVPPVPSSNPNAHLIEELEFYRRKIREMRNVIIHAKPEVTVAMKYAMIVQTLTEILETY